MWRRQFLALFALGFLGVLSLVAVVARFIARKPLPPEAPQLPPGVLVALSPVIVARTVLLNAIAGVAFGWLFWRRSLEAAMVAHASSNMLLFLVNLVVE
jgi:membrane protease YdiL (CAAX protease family)